MDKKDILERVAKATRRAYMGGFVAGSGDNVNMWIQGQVYIFPSGGYLGNLTTEDMIMFEVDGFAPSAGEPDYGSQRPSKEAEMHLACYGSRPDILCLFHLHSPYPIAMTYRRQEDRGPAMGVPTYIPGCAVRVGRIPVVPYYCPGSRGLVEAASGMICRRDSLLLASHGMAVAGKSSEAVLVVVEEIEENVCLAILLGDQGVPLDEKQTEALFQTGGKV